MYYMGEKSVGNSSETKPDYESDKKREILRGYLREYYVHVDPRLVKKLQKVPIQSHPYDYFVYGKRIHFKPFVAFYLLAGGRKDWKVINAYELIEIYLGHIEDVATIFQLNTPYVIMTYGNEEFENKRQWDIINQFVAWRQLQRFRTVIFAFNTKAISDYRSKMSAELRTQFKEVDLTSI